ncbi:hypothetical protein [Wolbachia endosymbiont (group A) of Conops quadrifasciatus]|uniref:hypothetical protein n=1 Tax=Wolbachia endosymbiont (group A) of Conops quadrifasciatus TaxID=3066143 RepID=UPI003132B368
MLGIIFLIVAEASEEEISNMQDRALKIIDELRDHINDDIEVNNNLRMPTLDWIAFCDSHDGVRLNNRSLLDLEDAVKSIGGKTSQELERVRGIPQQINNLGLAEILAQYQAHVREREERNLRIINSIGIFGVTFLGANPGESEVGEIVGATFGGLLSMPIMVMLPAALASIFVRGEHITSREVTQELIRPMSEPMAGLSAALAGGTIMLFRSIVGSIAGTNMEFGESLRSGLIAATGAGIGAALSTALVRRTFAPVSTNLENVATEQPNIQGQNI